MVHLDYLLKQSFAEKDYLDQIKWLIQIFKWLRSSKDSEKFEISKDKIYSAKLKYLLQLLSRNPSWKSNFVATISAILKKMSSVNLFTDAGLSLNTSFTQELLRRLEEKLLPKRFVGESLSVLLLELFPEEDDSILVDGIDENVLNDLFNLFVDHQDLILEIIKSIRLSLDVIATQLLANAYTLNREIHGDISQKQSWPEYQIQREISSPLNTWGITEIDKIYGLNELCNKSLNEFLKKMKNQGIKLDCVFLIESQRQRLQRMHLLTILLDLRKPKAISIRLFISTLILDLHHQISLKSFFSENLSMLSNQIILKNSHIGEHYAAFDWKDYKYIYKSALGGGALTSITVYLKLFITSLGLTGFIKGFLEGLNYAGSFLGIQILGYTLATKQPSTTAPYLSKSLDTSVSEAKIAVLAILRAQLISVIGNLCLVFPICFAVSWLTVFFNFEMISIASSEYIIKSIDIAGPSVLFAMFTGILLFLSSLLAGWFENWSAVHNLSKRIEHNEGLQSILGKDRTVKLSNFLRQNSNALAANIGLGMLLGLVPQFVKFLGIPLEVRHITLATGQFAAALPTLISNNMIEWRYIILATLGLLVIGILNIAVSFGLALTLAGISSKRKRSILWDLIKWGIWTIMTRPWTLLPDQETKKDTK